MMTWIVLAGALGAGLYLKSKQSATTRWFMGTDEDLRKTPLAKIVIDLKTGLQLPEPPQGFQWKPVKIVIATNPLIAPDEIEINVLQQWLNDAPKPDGVSAFLISEQVGNPSALGSMGAYDLESFITTEAAADAPHGEDFVRYTLTDEHTMPNHGLEAYPEVAQTVAQAMQNFAPMLQWKGLALVCIPVASAGQDDFLFTSDRKLVVIRFAPPYGPVMVQEITPNRGAQYQMDRSRAVCAIGIRR